MLFLILITTLAAILLTIYYKSTRKFGYWKKHNVPHLPPTPFLGNYGKLILLKKSIGEVTQEICQNFPNEPYVGAYYGSEPTLIVQDPEILKVITTKDFYYFNSREIMEHTHKEVITQNMFFTYGDNWKVIRQNSTPLFSTGKMRNMFPLIAACSYTFEKYIDEEFKTSDMIEARGLMTRFTMACICSCAFGAEIDTLARENSDSPFIQIGKMFFANSNIRGIMNNMRAICPTLFYALGLKAFPDEVVNFFKSFVIGVFEGRGYKPTNRHDFIDLILNLRQQEYIAGDCIGNIKTGRSDRIEIPVTNDLLVAQCVLFFAAGYETSSTTLSYILYELARHPETQDKLLEEVDAYLERNGNKLDYNVMTEMPYAMTCISETLRMHPVLSVITREVVEDYTLPTGLFLEKGIRVHLPIYHLHHNPELFPEPEVFRPERFSNENKDNIKPQSYIPFGDGARVCIGKRFAKMQMLAGLITLLKKYRVETTPETPKKMEYDARAIVTIPLHLINLKLVPRDGWENRVFVK
ncbi:hypothetical protein ABMA27_008298 [Loxostege sticticalis]|uniref:unspecific monooxygenase n=1 Tax=Loxostege sticticalis TaxID=481309 RepID=A0ABR3HAS9_LOXSC